jgi:peptidoglycan biosynthesis protein MviN/MurJ (putative lipid II flippase)
MKLFWALRARVRNAHPDHHAIARSMAWVALFVFVGKLAGAAKEMAVAYRYGLGPEVDAYLFVFNLVSWPIGVWFSVLTVVLVPLAARMRQAEPGELPRFRSELLGLVILLGLVLAIAGWGGLPSLLLSSWVGLPRATAAIASDMAPRLAILAPLGVVVGLFSAWMLAAGRHTNTLLESTPALVILLALFAFPGGGVEPLVWGTLAGFACHLAALAVPLRAHGELEAPQFTRRSSQWTPFWRGFGIMLAGQALMSFTGLVDQFFAAHLGPGAIATLGYSNRILTLILGIGAVAVSRATLPVFSSAQAQGDEQVQRVAGHWVRLLFMLGTAAMIASWWLAPLGVRVLFERGAFSAQDTAVVAEVLRFGLTQLPFYFAAMVLVSLLASQRRHRAIAAVAGANLLIKLLAMALLTPLLGTKGIMLSTSIMYAATLLLLGFSARRSTV